MESTGHGYRLVVTNGSTVDLWYAPTSSASREAASTTATASGRVEAAEHAVDVLAAPLLPGLDSPWLEGAFARAELAALHRRALRAATCMALEAGRSEIAIRACHDAPRPTIRSTNRRTERSCRHTLR